MSMSVESTPFKLKIGRVTGVRVWKMPTHTDDRGRLFKAYSASDSSIFPIPFNTYEHFFTESKEMVFRGMHFQGEPHSVSKIISIVKGKALDFLFDFRKNSDSFGSLQIIDLDETNPASILVPVGVAHGYIALSETIISYKMDGPFCKNCDGGFNGALVSDYLPVSISETIRSTRDITMVNFDKFEYRSDCAP